MEYSIQTWKSPDGANFLQKRYETSLFLLGNLESFGPCTGDSPNSGNFKVVLLNEAIVGAFCLTKRGNLLVQGDDNAEIVARICEEALREPFKIAGVLGPWPIAEATWDYLQKHGAVGAASFRSKEVLYRRGDLKIIKGSDEGVRLLSHEDYEEWRPLRIAYLDEEGLRQDLSDEDFKKSFFHLVDRQMIWGAFSSERRLVSMAGLNTKANDIGQVGGVYTVPSLRGKGIAKSVMRCMMRRVQDIHGINRMILFTGEKNVAAQQLYERLGFSRCGHFGLIFS